MKSVYDELRMGKRNGHRKLRRDNSPGRAPGGALGTHYCMQPISRSAPNMLNLACDKQLNLDCERSRCNVGVQCTVFIAG